ncbi:hypothetical protein TTHERM_000248219 (macronuclear) [Tetrahymena thermophila SB210]|uniref:Uncharacterized protein n=1 Tax=Tetrahymena thermophila (strain SB210) TaxID=312017 RepID=W7XGM2_TETTS|nr:hypothetical protein TTHERM_000248219 [Tetrahymena thermophila SB210]EWS72089.1 hypothetical protein TTHERM_000248219 [Tetrahymena thermophila SB210]|eukprot:XP_012655400.1 hypothetical protein TTHERM_000248219 [Tetrahymena thermophila SB210]
MKLNMKQEQNTFQDYLINSNKILVNNCNNNNHITDSVILLSPIQKIKTNHQNESVQNKIKYKIQSLINMQYISQINNSLHQAIHLNTPNKQEKRLDQKNNQQKQQNSIFFQYSNNKPTEDIKQSYKINQENLEQILDQVQVHSFCSLMLKINPKKKQQNKIIANKSNSNNSQLILNIQKSLRILVKNLENQYYKIAVCKIQTQKFKRQLARNQISMLNFLQKEEIQQMKTKKLKMQFSIMLESIKITNRLETMSIVQTFTFNIAHQNRLSSKQNNKISIVQL